MENLPNEVLEIILFHMIVEEVKNLFETNITWRHVEGVISRLSQVSQRWRKCLTTPVLRKELAVKLEQMDFRKRRILPHMVTSVNLEDLRISPKTCVAQTKDRLYVVEWSKDIKDGYYLLDIRRHDNNYLEVENKKSLGKVITLTIGMVVLGDQLLVGDCEKCIWKIDRKSFRLQMWLKPIGVSQLALSSEGEVMVLIHPAGKRRDWDVPEDLDDSHRTPPTINFYSQNATLLRTIELPKTVKRNTIAFLQNMGGDITVVHEGGVTVHKPDDVEVDEDRSKGALCVSTTAQTKLDANDCVACKECGDELGTSKCRRFRDCFSLRILKRETGKRKLEKRTNREEDETMENDFIRKARIVDDIAAVIPKTLVVRIEKETDRRRIDIKSSDLIFSTSAELPEEMSQVEIISCVTANLEIMATDGVQLYIYRLMQ